MDKLKESFENIFEKIRQDESLMGSKETFLQFNLTDLNSDMLTMQMGGGYCGFIESTEELKTKITCRVTIASCDLDDVLNGIRSPVLLFSMGKLRLEGDISPILSLSKLL